MAPFEKKTHQNLYVFWRNPRIYPNKHEKSSSSSSKYLKFQKILGILGFTMAFPWLFHGSSELPMAFPWLSRPRCVFQGVQGAVTPQHLLLATSLAKVQALQQFQSHNWNWGNDAGKTVAFLGIPMGLWHDGMIYGIIYGTIMGLFGE